MTEKRVCNQSIVDSAENSERRPRDSHPPEKKPYRMANAMSAPLLVAPNMAKMRHPEIAVMGMITVRR